MNYLTQCLSFAIPLKKILSKMHYVTFQFSGGTILHMPYAPAIDDTVLRYLIGSENSSSEG